MARILILLISFVILLSGCAESGNIFPEMTSDMIATPNAMAFDVAANRLYVVNSNSEVLYDWEQGNFQVYDVTNPLAPVLLTSTMTASFSGQIYLDAAAKVAYVPNRYSPSNADTEDRLYVFNLDEASADFAAYTETPAALNPYAIDCCYPAGRMWVSTSENEMQYFDQGNLGSPGTMGLNTDLDTGGKLTITSFNHIVRINNQAFLSRENGGIMVVNLDKAGEEGVNAMDYWIRDVPQPRGIATDGTNIFALGYGSECDGGDRSCRFVKVIDATTMVPLTGNTTAIEVDTGVAGIEVAVIEVGKNPQEILLSTLYAFVTNQDDDTVSVIDRATYAVVATISVGDAPFSLALYVDGLGVEKYLYVGNVESNTFSIIDMATLSVVATYPQ